MNKTNKKEKEDFDPDIHGGGVEDFGTYKPTPEIEDEKNKHMESDGQK